MNILAIDTASERPTVALSGRRVWRQAVRPGREQDEALLPAVEAVLRRSGLRLSDVDAFAAASGPGRFTGIRIGMTAVAVLARAFRKPAVAVSRLEAAAYRAGAEGGRIAAVLAGLRPEEFFFQEFRRSGGRISPAGPPRWARREDLDRQLGCGKALASPGARDPLEAADLLEPARAKLAREDLGEFAPLYVKPASYERGNPSPR